MDSRERLLKALSHDEPDRVPFDLGGTHVTGIAVKAYKNLRNYLGLPEEEVEICDHVWKAEPEEGGWRRVGSTTP